MEVTTVEVRYALSDRSEYCDEQERKHKAQERIAQLDKIELPLKKDPLNARYDFGKGGKKTLLANQDKGIEDRIDCEKNLRCLNPYWAFHAY